MPSHAPGQGEGVIRALIVTLTALALTAIGLSTSSGAPDANTSHAASRGPAVGQRVRAPEHCPAANRAIGFYRRAYTASRTAMGLPGAPPRAWYPCDTARRRATEWRDRAWQAKHALARWTREQWAAPPEPFLSIARCENRGNGLYGVNWDAYNSVYEGAYGFLHSTWDHYKPAGYPESASTATIAQQTQVARILVATFGGYSSWPACHLRLGLPG